MQKLKKLFQEKKYSEVVFAIESFTTEKNRSAALYNILAVSRASQKGKTDRDVQYALNEFETAFYKDNLGEISLNSVCSHIKLCVEMGRKDSELINNILISEKMYLEAEKKFSKNDRYLAHGIDLYKYLIRHEEKIAAVKKVINKNGLSKVLGSSYITGQMYISDWKQKNFAEFQKKFSNIFSVLNSKKLGKIDLAKKKIKVGFYSPDFKQHPTFYFIKDLIKNLKQTKFETIALSLSKIHQHDKITDEYLNLFDGWINLGDKLDQEIVNTIQNENIDILIDLVGLWAYNRINIFNTRICPLQISWLGFNNSTGLKEVDFILADKNTVKDEEKEYETKIYKLPKIWNSHCGFEYKRVYNELPYKKNNYFTFGSFNNFMKVNDEVLDTWIEILKKVKNSKLVLKSSLLLCEEVIKKKFEKEGLKNSVEILKKTKREDFISHLNLYNKIDLCLDTFPFTGVTTTFEALWKNVPVISKAGYNFNSRCGESILRNANIENFIAKSNSDYVQKAVFYAKNINELEKTRNNLFDKIQKTPLFDTKGFSDDFSEALVNMQKLISKNYK
ncbi:hypothetical protein [Candidatus Pelagibacter communis]|uniref:O-linked N-acetylglucosamine transferase, SPINDLY family protein n=1 Tax=Pelagibacter ubique TaxID=198252 RepID=UPI0015CF150C|nr:hypothetical protein [Candidatus Pelagibacter ubique]